MEPRVNHPDNTLWMAVVLFLIAIAVFIIAGSTTLIRFFVGLFG